MFMSIETIIKIAILALQFIFYIIFYFMLRKAEKSDTIKSMIKSGKEFFKSFFGTVTPESLTKLIKELKKDKKPEEDEEKNHE